MSPHPLASTIQVHQGLVGRGQRLSRGVWNNLDIVIGAYLLALVSFSFPGRAIPDSATSLDLVGLTKLAVRLGIIAWFGIQILISIYVHLRIRVSSGQDNVVTYLAGLKWSSPILTPWLAFAVWALVSLLWSPLKSVSAGQWLGLVSMLVFAQIIYMRIGTNSADVPTYGTTTRQADPSASRQMIVYLLGQVLFLYSFLVLVVHLSAPEFSGLDRSQYHGVDDAGFVHPTAAGASASLGLVLSVVLLSLGWQGKAWMVIAGLVHAAVLFFSSSRAALAMAVLCILLCGMLLLGKQVRGLLFMGLGAVLLIIPIVDPGFELLETAVRGTSQYVQRGQSSEQLRAVSGRMEMWEAVWKEFVKSPVIGHGYFVSSETGRLAVWNSRANHDAHHIVLQVLVSTGLIGGVLFGWAVLRAISELLRLMICSTRGSFDREFGWLFLIIGLWYVGWSQGCVTFMGPIRPESVVFFALLGLLAATKSIVSRRGRIEVEGHPA